MLYNFKHVREEAQRASMETLEDEGICVFCREHLETYREEPIEFEGDWWVVTKNGFPYEGATFHYLLIYKAKHIVHCDEIAPEAWVELGEHISALSHKYNLPGGSMFMRFGDTDYNGSSISHLHAQVIVGVPHNDQAEGLRVKLGYKNAE